MKAAKKALRHKTAHWMAHLLGWRACQANVRVLFTTAMDMLNQMLASQVDHSLVRKLNAYTEPAYRRTVISGPRPGDLEPFLPGHLDPSRPQAQHLAQLPRFSKNAIEK
jgi:hypothetical protein